MRGRKFSFFSFLLTIATIALTIAFFGGAIYLYLEMTNSNFDIKQGVQDAKVTIRRAIDIVSSETSSNNNVTLSPETVDVSELEPVREEKMVSNYFFYNQLTDNGKIIYNKIESNLDKMKTGDYTIEFGTQFNSTLQSESGKASLKVDFQAAWDALALDNPMVYFIDVTKLYLTIESTTLGSITTYNTYIGPEQGVSYLMPGVKPGEIDVYNQKLEAIRNNVVVNVQGSDYDKLKQIHDVLVEQLEYDQSLTRNHTHDIYGALVERCCVCEGYAKAYKYLLDGVGIPCVLVSGKGTNSKGETEEHIWNYVLLENKWYAVDVTWDDPIVTGGVLTKTMKYKYFLRGGSKFNSNHAANSYLSNNNFRFEYPKLSENDYN